MVCSRVEAIPLGHFNMRHDLACFVLNDKWLSIYKWFDKKTIEQIEFDTNS
jgi:hypothetical protein